jgi:hypothetical protein
LHEPALSDARTVAIHLTSYGYSSSTLTGGTEILETGLATNRLKICFKCSTTLP